MTHLAPMPSPGTRTEFCSGMNIQPKHIALGEHGPAGGY